MMARTAKDGLSCVIGSIARFAIMERGLSPTDAQIAVQN